MDTEEIDFSGAGMRLSGSVSCPDTPGRCPGVVLVGGSGPADRHNDGYFDQLRGHLVDAGVAVFSYDKRGAGRSTGDWAPATVDDLARDAASAVTVLRSYPRVDPGSVGIFGHSEGGWVALRVAAWLSTPQYLILNSCPAVPFAEAEVYALTTAGVGLGPASELLRQLADAARAGYGHQRAQQILGTYRAEPWYPLLAQGGFVLGPDTWAQFTAWADYDPYGDLVHLKTPTLAIFGESDPLIPVRTSTERHQETAARAGRYSEVHLFPDAGHRLQAGAGFVPGYLATVTGWCLRQGAPATPPPGRAADHPPPPRANW